MEFGYSQTLSTGQSYSISGGGTKTSADGSYPTFQTPLSFSITQPLLKNRGSYVNRLPLMEAESTYKQSGFNLTSNLLSLINNAENVYWNAISARETVTVDQSAHDAAKYNWDFIQKQFSLGAVSYLDTYNPQQALAAARPCPLAGADINLAKRKTRCGTRFPWTSIPTSASFRSI